MAEETNTKPREDQGRSFGQVLADWGKGALEGAANAGSIKGMLPGVVFGGLKGAIYGDEDQKNRDLQTKRLELANKQLEQNIAQSAESHNLSVEGQKTVNKINALRLIAAQVQDDDNTLARAKADADGIFKRGIGYDNKTFLAQGIIDKNKSIQTANNLSAMYNVFQQNPEQGKRLFARAGWRIEGKDGNYEVTSLDGTRRQPLSQMMEKMSGSVLKRAREAVEAADLFEKTTSLDQCSIRNMITDFGVAKYFTTQGADGKASVDYASAYSAYKDYISANASKDSKVFSDEDLMGHMLSRTLQEALVDNRLTPDEMKMLMPQFAMYLEKFRASVTLPNGGDPRAAMVKLADGTQKDIMTFAKELKERDRVARGFEQYLNEQHIKKQIAAADMAGKIAESRKKVAQAVKAENEAKGSSGQETAAESGIPEDIDRSNAKAYGENYYDLTVEQKKNLQERISNLDKLAGDYGLTREINGKEQPFTPQDINPTRDLPKIKKLADKERKILEDLDLSKKGGYWNNLLTAAEEQKETINEDKRQRKAEKQRDSKRRNYKPQLSGKKLDAVRESRNADIQKRLYGKTLAEMNKEVQEKLFQ